MTKNALITGITGQDGAYLAELLLEKGYAVHGLVRRSSTSNLHRIRHLCDEGRLFLHAGDLGDASTLKRALAESQPDEVYNLAAMSDVKMSFDLPEYTADVDGVGVLRFLEAIRHFEKPVRFYQASTSELFGKAQQIPQNEKTSFYPRSPYGAAKLYAYWAVVNYREAYRMYACNGILFNHESPLRGENFVSRKITLAVSKIHHGLQEILVLGNLDSRRDWGFAKDFVYGMWQILQQDKPEDFVLATGKTTAVREFVELAFEEIGIQLVWEGKGVQEKGKDQKTGKVLVVVSPEFFRPTEVDLLIGDATKARQKLGWEHKTSVQELVKLMVQEDLKLVERELKPTMV